MNFWVYYIVVRECENVVCIVSTLWKWAGFPLWPNIWSIFVDVLWHLKRLYIFWVYLKFDVQLLNQSYECNIFLSFFFHVCRYVCMVCLNWQSLNVILMILPASRPSNCGFVSFCMSFQQLLLSAFHQWNQWSVFQHFFGCVL